LRKLIIALSALAFAVPAAAQPRPDPRDEEMSRRLPPPGEIEEIGDRLGRVAEAVMDVPVGPVVDAVDPYGRRRHRDETLGDIASRDDPYARERIRGSIGAATYGIEAAIRQLAILTPVLRRSIEDASRRMDDAMRGRAYPRDRDWDRDVDRGAARDWDRDRDVDRDWDRDRDEDPDRDRDVDPDPDRDEGGDR
jgi:hypothetical protein